VAAEMTWDRAFDLVVMASNMFQVFVPDHDLRGSLAATRAALVDGGRLVFGTRNPRVRAWEGWNPSSPIDVVDHAGRELRVSYQVESVAGDVVTFTETTATRAGEPLRVHRASLRFLDAEGSTGPSAPPGSRSRPGMATGRGDRSPTRATTSSPWPAPRRPGDQRRRGTGPMGVGSSADA
jgi:hypothetical protein